MTPQNVTPAQGHDSITLRFYGYDSRLTDVFGLPYSKITNTNQCLTEVQLNQQEREWFLAFQPLLGEPQQPAPEATHGVFWRSPSWCR